MFKYILKRLGISVIILFGVSIILYSLVRMMPADYITQKFSSQVAQGSMSLDDIDNFKKLYGLYNPEAEIRIKVDGYDSEFAHDVTVSNYESQSNDVVSFEALLVNNSKECTFKADGYRLKLSAPSDTASYTFSLQEVKVEVVEEKDDDGNVTSTHNRDVVTEVKHGTFTATIGENGPQIILTTHTGDVLKSSTTFHKFGFFSRTGTMLGGYFTWLGNLCKGDLGRSWKYEDDVSKVITDNMWISFAIAVVATILQFLIAIPLGITSATHQYSARDYIVTVLTMIGISLPTYFFAAILIKIFAVNLGWFPSSGLNSSVIFDSTFLGQLSKFGDTLHHLVLPIFCTVFLSIGGLMRYTRTNMLEVLSADYIRTARAKGLSEKKVIYKHAFRNTLIPLVTLLAGILPSLFGGMMITEQVFGIPGIGQKAYNALMAADIPFVMGYNMFLAVLSVLGTLLSDIMYSVVDPRVKLGK